MSPLGVGGLEIEVPPLLELRQVALGHGPGPGVARGQDVPDHVRIAVELLPFGVDRLQKGVRFSTNSFLQSRNPGAVHAPFHDSGQSRLVRQKLVVRKQIALLGSPGSFSRARLAKVNMPLTLFFITAGSSPWAMELP